MLISPTEPVQIRRMGQTSLKPESHGSDILLATRMGLVGIQRKEVKDLVASVYDGRLDKELSQMKSLDGAILIVEGKQLWSSDGLMLGIQSRWSRKQQIGLELSAQLRGCWTLRSGSITETIDLVLMVQDWAMKERDIISQRHGPMSPWGSRGSTDWLYHLIQGLEGVGPKLARVIVDRYGCPFKWKDDVTVEGLMTLEGIGIGRAEKIYGALGGDGD